MVRKFLKWSQLHVQSKKIKRLPPGSLKMMKWQFLEILKIWKSHFLKKILQQIKKWRKQTPSKTTQKTDLVNSAKVFLHILRKLRPFLKKISFWRKFKQVEKVQAQLCVLWVHVCMCRPRTTYRQDRRPNVNIFWRVRGNWTKFGGLAPKISGVMILPAPGEKRNFDLGKNMVKI